MTGQHHNFTLGTWYGLMADDQYLATLSPITWTRYPEDAWMSKNLSDALQWGRSVRRHVRGCQVFRCQIHRTWIGALQVVNHQLLRTK